MRKRQEFVVRMVGAAPAATSAYMKAQLPTTLKQVRAVHLLSYFVRGVTAGNPSLLWQLKLGNAIHIEQTNNTQAPGYLFPVSTLDTHVVFDNPRLLTSHGLAALSEINVTVCDHAGAPVIFDEAVFFFEFVYDEETTNLSVVAAEQGIKETLHGTNNWRAPGNHKSRAQDTFGAMADHIFSESTK